MSWSSSTTKISNIRFPVTSLGPSASQPVQHGSHLAAISADPWECGHVMPLRLGTWWDMSQIIEFNDNNADAPLPSSVPVLVDFPAVWCPPCRVIAPHVEAIAAKYDGRLLV